MKTKINQQETINAVENWISSRLSRETRSAYRRDFALWREHADAEGIDLSRPALKDVIEFRDGLAQARAPLTVRRSLAALSAIYKAVFPDQGNVFSERLLPRPPNITYSQTKAISDEDARKALESAALRGLTPLRDVAILQMLFTTGMRRVSVCSIRRASLELRDKSVVVKHLVKGGRLEESELARDAAEAILNWLKAAPPSDYLFCLADGRRMSPQQITNIVVGCGKACGIKIHPHQFRSGFITAALDAGIPLEKVRAVVHHSDGRSTLRYDRGQRGAGVIDAVSKFRTSRKVDT